jgi:hypothetical protein
MPSKSDPTPTTLDCEQARTEIRTFAGSRVPAARARVLRLHLLECEDCNAFYRESLETAARLGGNLRADREQGEAEATEVRREAARSLDKVRQRKPNSSRLRTVLLPAFFFFLMVFVTRAVWPGDRVQVADWGGPVFIDDEPFLREGSPKGIRRGRWLVTGAAGRLELKNGSARLALGERTFLLVEDPAAHRFRFRGGDLRVSGPCSVTTTHGVLELEDGTATLDARGASFELICEAGGALFIDATGEHRLEAGERVLRDVR